MVTLQQKERLFQGIIKETTLFKENFLIQRDRVKVGFAVDWGSEGHSVIRLAVINALGIMERRDILFQKIEIVSSPHKSPRIILLEPLRSLAEARGIPEWRVSLTHDNGLAVAVAVGTSAEMPLVGVGVDLTFGDRMGHLLKNPDFLMKFRQKILHNREKSFLYSSGSDHASLARIWAIKEAAYKAIPSPKPHFSEWIDKLIVTFRHDSPAAKIVLDCEEHPVLLGWCVEVEGAYVAFVMAYHFPVFGGRTGIDRLDEIKPWINARMRSGSSSWRK